MKKVWAKAGTHARTRHVPMYTKPGTGTHPSPTTEEFKVHLILK